MTLIGQEMAAGQLRCARCGARFERRSPKGVAPRYCSTGCRSAAYEERAPTEPMMLRLTPVLRARLRARAEADGVTMVSVVRRALVDYLGQPPRNPT